MRSVGCAWICVGSLKFETKLSNAFPRSSTVLQERRSCFIYTVVVVNHVSLTV